MEQLIPQHLKEHAYYPSTRPAMQPYVPILKGKKINQTQRKRNNPLLSSKAGPEARPKPSSMERFQTGDRHAPDVQNARCAM